MAVLIVDCEGGVLSSARLNTALMKEEIGFARFDASRPAILLATEEGDNTRNRSGCSLP